MSIGLLAALCFPAAWLGSGWAYTFPRRSAIADDDQFWLGIVAAFLLGGVGGPLMWFVPLLPGMESDK